MPTEDVLVELARDVGEELHAVVSQTDARGWDKLLLDVSANPGYADLRYQLASRYYVAGRLKEALDELDAALVVNIQFVDALRLKVRILSERGELRAALEACKRLIAVDIHSADAHLTEAVLHARLGDHAASIGAARNAADLARGHWQAYLLLAEEYLCLDELRLARRNLERAVRLKPADDIAYLLALVCIREGDFASAESNLRQALELNERNRNAAVRLATLKVAEGDYTAAHRLLSEIIVHYPAYPDLQYGLARVCVLMGRQEEAYRRMKVALELNPRYAEVQREIATLCDANEPREALGHAERSIQNNPSDEQAVINLGHIYNKLGDRERAVEVLERAAEQFPDSWRILETLGILQLQGKAYAKARLALKAAARINPEIETTERSLRIVFRDETLLEDERDRLVAQYPEPRDQPILFHHLGRIYLEFHKEKLSGQYFRQSYEAGYAPAHNAILLATLHANQSDYVTAIDWLAKVNLQRLERNICRLLAGLFHANSGDHERSTRFYQEVMTDSPLFFHSLDGLAVCFREREELEDMLDDYLDYARYNVRNAPLYRRIGLAYANKGMLVEARRHFDHATVLDSVDGQAYHALGTLCLLRLDMDEAKQKFETASRRQPDWPIPHLSLALLHLEWGNRAAAAAALDRYLLLETTPCWRDAAESLRAQLSGRPVANSSSRRDSTIDAVNADTVLPSAEVTAVVSATQPVH